MHRIGIGTLLFALAACGGSSSGGFTIRGQSFSAVETISAAQVVSGSGSGVIVLSSRTGSCALAASNTKAKSAKGLVITVSDSAAIAAGSFPVTTTVGSGKSANVEFVSLDATCTDVAGQEATATSGSVTLTKVSGNALGGTFDLTFDSGDHVTGSFDGTACAGLVSSSGAATCG
jgi:hypothetical protein